MLETTQVSERRACRLAGLSRDVFRHPPEQAPATQALSARIIELAQVRRRFGYRRLHDLLRPEFPAVNHKKVYRLYREANLAVRRRKKARRPVSERLPLLPADAPNAVWSMDFVSDALANGRRLKCLTVADDFNCEALHIEVDTSISSTRPVRIFEQLKRDHGLPQVLRTDNGPEFLGEAFVQWAKLNGMAIRYIQPGKPNQNAYIERFNRTFREEVLDQHLFTRLDDVREAAYWWMLEYNEERPHDSLGDLTPAEYRQRVAGSSTFEMPA